MKMFVEDGLEQNQSQQPEKNNPDYWTKVIASTEQKKTLFDNFLNDKYKAFWRT